MTTLEFSDLFDLLYNNISSNQAPGLDEYEKSVFLTKALDEIIKSYFNPKLNKPQEGFDGSERRLIDFSMLVKVADTNLKAISNEGNIDKRTTGVKVVTMPTDALMILNEVTTVTRNGNTMYLQTIPLKYTEYTRLMSKPYARPVKRQAWRLQALDSTTSKADIIAGNSDIITNYEVRYIKRPRPIILADLEGVTIGSQDLTTMFRALIYTSGTLYYTKEDNVYVKATVTAEDFPKSIYYTKGKAGSFGGNAKSECELDVILHEEILQRAVELAKAAWQGDLASSTQIGNLSSTEKGIIPQSNNR